MQAETAQAIRREEGGGEMNETVRVDLPVIRDAAGNVCCVNERGDECAVHYAGDAKPMCAFGSDALQLNGRVLPLRDCPLIWSLRAEGRS